MRGQLSWPLFGYARLGHSRGAWKVSRQANITTQFTCDLFLANAVHASHVCDIVGDLAVHTLQLTWDTQL